MNSQFQINVPEWFVLDELHILETIISPTSNNMGIIVASENFDAKKRCYPTVRLYMIHLVDDQYELTKELDAFQFRSVEEAKQFATKLPNLNAMDFIMMLNKEEPAFSM
ncbi:geranylgeranyl pyrophosphate synthase [Solibacillus sp. R5-41]|uniref:geranylgeranyl pyrophosphate synthase n=1 Tax=Solibacillus sp. R5-41 TaxID=2048654 RepID=UPI000C125103|nr:geranylgeranyl pyrophosphate synthase [Solibacillus sp. R5-41]ATP39451.1 geranylgeranyl pyrophosphate synthase [Solibacillus sp. R5-41]